MKSINLRKIKKYEKLLNKIYIEMKTSYDNIDKYYCIFYRLGIKSNVHVGSNKLKYNSRKSKLRRLEWMIGQFMDSIETRNIYAIITWENCFPKFMDDKFN